MKQLFLAFQFLTIIPLKIKGDVSKKDIARSAIFFPIVGAFQGLLIVLSAILLLDIFHPEVVSGVLILILILSNGGFHLDGIADTFDAIAVKSTSNKVKDREKRLSVMKDSTIGAIGVIAIVITILIKFSFINFIISNTSLPITYSLLFLMPVFSKWIMILSMYHGVSARSEGLGQIFINNIRINTVVTSSLILIFMYALIAKIHLFKIYGNSNIKIFLILCTVLYIFSIISAKFCNKRFGGLTGDNLGAVSEISEILFLMVVSIWL